MDQINNYADSRLLVGCIYCGGSEETTEHVPSRVLLDEPFPDNLPTMRACRDCNNGFAKDEEYFACLLGAVIAGTTDPDRIDRPRVARILRGSPALRARIESGRREAGGQVQFAIETDRVRNVLVKLARGHVAFELGQVRREEPATIWWSPIALMSAEAREAFNACHIVQLFGEIGSRGMQRTIEATLSLQHPDGQQSTLGFFVNDWVHVQQGRYRYLAIDECNITIRMVIAEYLACEVTWGECSSP